MRIKGDDDYLAGSAISLADYYLAPIWAYVALTEDASKLDGVAGFKEWWARIEANETFKFTAPDLG